MALLYSGYLDAVVSIGIEEKKGFKSLATGFLVGFLTGERDAKGAPLHRTFLITNRHVFDGFKQVILRFNLTQEGFRTYSLILEDANGKRWLAHQNESVDIAAISVSTQQLNADAIKYTVISEGDIAYLDTILTEGISQGDGVFVLGFPMGIAGREKNYAIVRSGIIARLDREIINSDSQFLIDATVFPGNSGGPVILRPETSSLKGTKAVKKSYLIGVARSYLTYEEKAISEQTGRTRIVFIENSGIAGVVPMDFVKETVQPLMSLKSAERVREVART